MLNTKDRPDVPSLPDNDELLAERISSRERSFAEGPQVGDFIILEDDTERRVAHDWGKDSGLQPTLGGAGGSFYLADGYASHSGGMDRTIPHDELVDTGQTRPGAFWFFSRNIRRAGNGISVKAPCRIYRHEPQQRASDSRSIQ
jgi:hypothetical protein